MSEGGADILFPANPLLDTNLTGRQKLTTIVTNINARAANPINPFSIEGYFTNERFWAALPEEIRTNDELFSSYVENTVRFHDVIHDDRSQILGEVKDLPAEPHPKGMWRAESGEEVSLDKLRALGIDPSKVFMFRITEPGGPKPERFWTSDYFEVAKGLSAEIPDAAKRKSMIIMVSDLETISRSGGLIIDHYSTENGMGVRQIQTVNFDQNAALFQFSANPSPN